MPLLLQISIFSLIFMSSHDLIHSYQNNSIVKHYCGSSLSGALFSVCKKSGFVAHFSPRAEINRKFNCLHFTLLWFKYFVDNFNSSQYRLLLGSTRGIIDECCMNPCSKDQLIQYCQKKFARISITKKRCAHPENHYNTQLIIITMKSLIAGSELSIL